MGNRHIRTNKDLYRFFIVNSTLCEFCNQSTETVRHLFWDCHVAQSFWSDLNTSFKAINIIVDINFTNISFGILNLNQHRSAINFIVLHAKYFIFKCKCLQQRPTLQHFKNSIKSNIDIERIIAQRKGKYETHCRKWNPFIQLYQFWTNEIVPLFVQLLLHFFLFFYHYKKTSSLFFAQL